MADIAEQMRLWDVSTWETNHPRGARLSSWNQAELDRTVKLTYTKDGTPVTLVMGRQSRAVDNQAIEEIRKRGT